MTVALAAERYSGPLPHPRHLKAYEDVAPGSAAQIIAMARKEQNHRHRLQTLEMLYPYLGWLSGSLGFFLCVAGAVFLAMHDRDSVALALLGLPVLGVVGWFVRSRVNAPVTDEAENRGPTRSDPN